MERRLKDETLLNTNDLYKIARSMDRKGQTIAAVDKYMEVLEKDPSHLYARMRLAYIYHMIGGNVSMRKELDLAIKHDPSAVIVYDDVFYGCGRFYEYKEYKTRTLSTRYFWEKKLDKGWHVVRCEMDNHIFLNIENKERFYPPDLPVDAEILIYEKGNDDPKYLITRRRCSDNNFYNFLCRFIDGKQFRTEDMNNFNDERSVFYSYINTIEKEFELVT